METLEHGIGERCYFEEFLGTVRYVGEVPPTTGLWYGVAWDDERGKHNGTLNGVQYFSCKEKHGSFVRRQKISFGTSATDALEKVYGIGKYQEDVPIILNKETNHAKTIEMVGFDKIATRQSDFSSLKEVDLSKCNISSANLEYGLEKILPNLKSLQLRGNLLSSLKDVVLIAGKIETLITLNISDNRLCNYDLSSINTVGTFSKLTTMFLNHMCMNWNQLVSILKIIPFVNHVHACFNNIEDVCYDNALDNIETLNIDGNQICNWNSILQLSSMPRLNRLILNDNKVDSVVIPSENSFINLTSISFNGNLIDQWKSLNELDKLKNLDEIRFKKNPVSKDLTSFLLRQEVIARLGNVTTTNGSKIDEGERRVAEMAYIKKYSKDYFVALSNNSVTTFETDHPRYKKLIEIHGEPVNEVQKPTSLKDTLLLLTIRCPDVDTKPDLQKKVLPTITIQQLKGILQRHFKVQSSKQKLSYFDAENNREIEIDDSLKQLTYYSVRSSDVILLRW